MQFVGQERVMTFPPYLIYRFCPKSF